MPVRVQPGTLLPRPAAASGRRPHIPALDGLRGLAFLWVFLFHAYGHRTEFLPVSGPVGTVLFRFAGVGSLGVDLFFALSGFLITGILIQARTAPHFFRNFYARRALRIFPVYYAAVATVLVLLPLGRQLLHVEPVPHYPWWNVQVWFWLNLSNLRTATQPMVVWLLAHFWSLAVEEQFYLVWPAVVRFVPQRLILPGCAGLLVLAEVGRNLPTVAALNRQYPEFSYRFTLTHCDGLLCGAMLAVLLLRPPRGLRRALLAVAAAALLVYTAAILSPPASRLYFEQRWAALVAGLGFASAIGLLMLSKEGSWLRRALGSRVLVWLGALSYCLYVVHIPVLIEMEPLLGHVLRGHAELALRAVPPVSLAVSLALAMLSRRFLEAPALRLKRYFP